MFWCFHCYALNDHPGGPCSACGEPVEEPDGLSHVDRLVWTLRHPDGDRAIVAAQILGRLNAQESAMALRETVEAGSDIFLRAEALRSLLMIKGPESLRPWLNTLSRNAAFNIRDIAREALHGVIERYPA